MSLRNKQVIESLMQSGLQYMEPETRAKLEEQMTKSGGNKVVLLDVKVLYM